LIEQGRKIFSGLVASIKPAAPFVHKNACGLFLGNQQAIFPVGRNVAEKPEATRYLSGNLPTKDSFRDQFVGDIR
jgi:hypothetical protein